MTKAPTPSARLRIKVVPRSTRDEVVGWLGDALKIKVTAPPQKRRANEAVVALIADRGVRTPVCVRGCGDNSARLRTAGWNGSVGDP